MDELPEGCVAIDERFRAMGYKSRELLTDDPYTMYVIYFKDFRRMDKNMMLRIELKFDMAIHDDPGGSYEDNHELHFEEARLAVYDRRMEEDPEMFDFPKGPYYLEETENLKRYGLWHIHVRKLGDVEALERMLGDA